MKNFLLFVALVSIAGLAIGATSATEVVIQADFVSMQPASKAAEVSSPEHSMVAPPGVKLTSAGKVLKVIDSPLYTYLKVSGDKGPIWLAAYKIDVTRGSTVKYSGGIPMQKFYSKSLKRTFDLIIFVDGLELVME